MHLTLQGTRNAFRAVPNRDTGGMYLFRGIEALEEGQIDEGEMIAINHEVWGTLPGKNSGRE